MDLEHENRLGMVSDDKKENAVIRRVGIWFGLMVALCLANSAAAETIPFDYWYGRIIGRTRIRAIHDAFNDQRGALTANFTTGFRETVRLNLGDLLTIEPTSSSDTYRLTFYRPEPSAESALGARSRWLIGKLDWRDGSSFYRNDDYVSSSSSSFFVTDQTFNTQAHEIEYDSSRSLYYYLAGKLLQPGNWDLNCRLNLGIGDSFNKEVYHATFSDSPDTLFVQYQSETDQRYWSAYSHFKYGLSRKFQLSLSGTISRSSYPSKYTTSSRPFAATDSVISSTVDNSTDVRRIYEFAVEPLWLINPGHWISVRPSFANSNSPDRGYRVSESDSLGRSTIETREFSLGRTYRLLVNHTWLSGEKSISREQILDDVNGYYGRRPNSGTLRINTSVSLMLDNIEYNSHREEDSAVTKLGYYWMRTRDFTAATSLTYYSPLGIDASIGIVTRRNSFGYGSKKDSMIFQHYQTNSVTIRLDFYSYRYDSSRRREIGWDKISDIDYLHGPLLRPKDVHSSFVVSPPRSNWFFVSPKGNIFNFYKGEPNHHWTINVTNAIGVCPGVELGLDFDYDRSVIRSNRGPDDWRRDCTETLVISRTVRWQPGNGFRIDFSARSHHYWRDIHRHRPTGDFDQHTSDSAWQLYTVYTMLF